MNAQFTLMPGFFSYLNADVGLRTGTGSGIGSTLVDMLVRLRASNSGEAVDIDEVKTAYPVPELLRDLKATTGLSWSKIGELFGVSRRAVYDWLEGKPVAAHNYERLLSTHEAMRNVSFDSPFHARTFLLFSDAAGATPFQVLKDGAYSDFIRFAGVSTVASVEPLISVAARLSARQDTVHTDLPGRRRSTASRRISAGT